MESEPTVISKSPPLSTPSIPAPVIDVGRQLEGQQLGHFELREYVGGGGMGSVFRSLDRMLNRVVAVKVLAPEQAQDDDTLKRFKNEAQSAARLDHENIGRVYYVGEDRGLHYIVFEFIEGVNLRDLIEQRGPLSLAEAVNYTLQIAEALDHASRRDVVHRDIKPSNVVITPEGRAKLVDMGLARLHQQLDRSQEDLTASGVTLGTFDYISPEQARDPRSADVRSDLYSLGCTFYFMLTGRPPFPEGTVLQKLLQHQGDEPPDPREFRPDLPDEVTRIMRRMLAKTPERRYQRPNDLVGDLMLLASVLGLRSRTTGGLLLMSPAEVAPSFWDRHLPWIAPSVALIVISLCLHFLWTPSSTSELDSFLEHRRARASGAESGVAANGASTGLKENSGASADVVSKGTPTGELPAGSQGMQKNGSGDNVKSTATISVGAQASSVTQGPLTDTMRAWISNGARIGDLASFLSSNVADLRTRLHTAATKQFTASKPTPTSTRVSERKGLLVVSRNPQGPDSFSSLRAACSIARNGDVIELQYDGILEEHPLELTNLRLTIRAHPSHRPTVSFRPDDSDPAKYARNMISVSGGQLTLLNVHLVLELPKHLPAEMWSLLEARRANLIRLESCSLTIRHGSGELTSFGQDATFLHVRSAPGGDGSLMTEGAMPLPVTVQLENCIVRGAAVFLRASDLQPLELTWNNGLLVTTEHFLTAAGGSVNRRQAGDMRLDLRHLTAITTSGFAHFSNSPDAPLQLTTEINCADSILMAAASAPFIEQTGDDTVDEFRSKISWNGDRNFYQGYTIFWKIMAEGGRHEPTLLGFNEWKAFWNESHERLPSLNSVQWLHLPNQRPLNEHQPSDYELRGVAGDASPLLAASDGLNAGAKLDLLPNVPAEQPSTASQTAAESANTIEAEPATSGSAGTMRTMGTMKVVEEPPLP
jgi:serine/threonine-protein kinase